MRTTFVLVSPAGVEVAKQDGLMVMDTALYSPNLLSTPTPDCEAVPDSVG